MPSPITDKPVGLARVVLPLPASIKSDVMDAVVTALEDEAISISWVKNDKGWNVQWVFETPTPLHALIKAIARTGYKTKPEDFTINDISPDTNWLEESYRGFPPFSVGPFFLFGSHYDGLPPKGTIPLQIDAATAFGSGEHGTTRGCLDALQFLHAQGLKPKNILDMGAGSGVLAIAAYKLWKKPTLAIDIDKEATRVACRHRKMNAIPSGEKGMICATGDGYAARRVRATSRGFSLIIANILAGPLTLMASDLSQSLSKQGTVILSGLLTEQEKEVLAAHQHYGLTLVKRITHGEWRTLILER